MNDLTARIDEQLAATEGHTAGPWHVSERVGEQVIVRTTSGQGVATSLNRDEDHPDAALIASAPTLRALLVEARAQLAAQAEALAAEREQISLLRLDNDGHMECLAETRQDLLRELPNSETTALLGRMLARWQRTPGQRQYVALSEVERQAEALAAVRGALGTVLDEAYDGQHSYRVDLSTLRAAYETLGAQS